jgi:type III secretion protein T
MSINYNGDYLSFLFSLPKVNPTSLLCLFLLGVARLGPIISFVPFLGSKLPGPAKMGLCVILVAILMPHIVLSSQVNLTFDSRYIGYLIKELFIGVLLALITSCPFLILQGSGGIIDFQRGASSLQVSDPSTQTQTSSIGIFFNYIMILVFFETGCFPIYLETLIQAYTVLPPDKLLSSAFFTFHHIPSWSIIVGLIGQFIALSIQLSAPSLLAILMTETFLGIANR